MKSNEHAHVYYKIDMKLLSPLCIGSGSGDRSDNDVVRDSNGFPVIPGTSFAGVYRGHLSDAKKGYFGDKNEYNKSTRITTSHESPVIVYDGVLAELENNSTGIAKISVRDSVALDEWKVAVEGAKFDFEVIETGTLFTTYIELRNGHDPDIEDTIEKCILPSLNGGDIKLGHNTSRGFGRIGITGYSKMAFDFCNKASINKWLNFDMFSNDCWDSEDFKDIKKDVKGDKLVAVSRKIIITVPLKIRGAVSIRQYETGVSDEGESPDYVQLTENGEPVIPGTSWAGAFKHRISEWLNALPDVGAKESYLRELFGYVSIEKTKKGDDILEGADDTAKKVSQRSKIEFAESVILDGEWKTVTRNAIDRFSGGTKDTALFTEKTHYHGTTELEVRLDSGVSSLGRQLAYAAILDLCRGYLAVGGLTAVGHGIFEYDSGKKIKLVDPAGNRTTEYDETSWEGLVNGGE
jgi:CRISPR/Cas system CSM-associated protein Csm3 (group 7 of RAMP superfamily)